MVSKTRSKPFKTMKKGLTMIELIAATAVVLVLLAVVVMNVNPVNNQNKAKDVKRISDLTLLDSAINQYRMDNKNYPDSSGVLRTSTLLPSGNTQLESPSSGWIDQDLSKYLSRMPTDPINDGTYHYSYIQNGSSYEINARLESLTDQMQNDGGNDPNMYEIGNNLSLISP
jgi:general secretion pathway protein G